MFDVAIMPAPISSSPVGLWTRIKARFALFLSRAAPSAYQRWASAGLARWQEVPPFSTFETTLAEARVALVSSGGILVEGQEPFDLENPRGDCSFRVIPADADLSSIRISHMFYDTAAVGRDTAVMLPLAALKKLVAAGTVGHVAPRHFSLSGSIPDPSELVSDYAPEIAQMLVSDEVDLVLLVPA